MKLEDVDLTPIRETIIDLLGRQTVEAWQPFGGTHSSKAGADLMPDAATKTQEAFAMADKVVRTTKESLVAFLTKHGRQSFVEEKRSTLKSAATCVLYDAWFPRRFVNAAESIYVGCACGYEGHAQRIPGTGKFACGGCSKPGYLQLRAMRDWYAKS
jgi:hypothetical protein